MKSRVLLSSMLAGLLAVALPAMAQLKVGIVTSSTGPGSVVGIPQKNTAQILPKKIGGLDVEYVMYDDASDPTQAVQLFKKLLSEHKVDAIIGPSLSPSAVGVIQFVAEEKTPMLAPVGTPAVVLPMDEKKKWVFKTTQNDDLIADALVGHMVKAGVKTVGFIGLNDPYGEAWAKTFTPMAEKVGIKIVASERYNRADQSVIGQVAKLMSAKPDAVLVAGAGGPTVLPHATLTERGFKGTIYQTHGAAAPDFLKLGGKNVEGAVLAASLMLVLDQMPDSHPSKKVAAGYIATYEKQHGSKPATFGANVWDAWLLLDRAVPAASKKAKPGSVEFRTALRDSLEGVKELVGAQGVYNMTAADHSGFDKRGRVLITVKDGAWKYVAE